MRHDDKQAIALWRLGVLGPLVSARLEHGDRRRYFIEAAARTHERPDGRRVQLSARTIEAWHSAYRRGGFPALFPHDRDDRGRSRAISAEVAEQILRVKRERPRRSIRRIIRMLERAHVVRAGELHRSTVHRLLVAHGVSARPVRGPAGERRSFLPEHAGDLWVGDALHGPPGDRARRLVAQGVSAVPDRRRYPLPAPQLLRSVRGRRGPGIRLQAGHREARAASRLLRRPRLCLHRRLARAHLRGARHPSAPHGRRGLRGKGAIERWHRTWREEVGDELPDEPLALAELNAKHWAWLAAEYHSRRHDTTGRAPREHWLDELPYLRTLPRHQQLDEVFLHRERRFVRKDGTVRFRGGFLEVRPELVGREVELRFDPRNETARPRVFVEDRFVCDTVPLDRLRNASRRRRRSRGEPAPDVEPSGLDPLALIEAEHYQRVRPVGASTPAPVSPTPNDPRHEED